MTTKFLVSIENILIVEAESDEEAFNIARQKFYELIKNDPMAIVLSISNMNSDSSEDDVYEDEPEDCFCQHGERPENCDICSGK